MSAQRERKSSTKWGREKLVRLLFRCVANYLASRLAFEEHKEAVHTCNILMQVSRHFSGDESFVSAIESHNEPVRDFREKDARPDGKPHL